MAASNPNARDARQIRREALSWILLFMCCLVGLNETSQTNEARVVCYYTNWSVYRPGTAKFGPQNVNPYLCTHLIYAFGGFTKDNKLKPFDKYQDIEKGGYAKFTGLKSYNKNLKTMLAIGGWNEGSSRFSPLVASAERRREFIKNTVKFLRQNHFDGLDLDWEYPAYRDGGKPRDKDNYAQFVQELREEFDRESQKTGRERLLLTMAVPAGTEYIKKGYDIPKLNKYLDWFNLLSYDYHSAFEPSVNHHAPLFPLEEASEYNYDSELNIDYSIKFYLNEGADRSKLVLGIPTYGRSYTLLNEDATEIGSPSDGPGAQGDATREKGYLAYYEICQSIQNDEDWTVVQPNPKAMGPYAFKENQWVGYDDEAIARKKGEYVVANGLGGIMFWSIDNDDFRGACHGRPYPIIEAAKEAMLGQISGNENDVSVPTKRRKPNRSRSRSNTKSKTNAVVEQDEEKASVVSTRRRPVSTRRKPTQSTIVKEAVSYSSARTTTPEPPTTPDPGADFKCEDEGFFAHPRDCKKYFWCLDSGPSNLGIVAHQFTCPSGLFFNQATDSCDYTRNVQCTKPKTVTTESSPTTTARSTTAKSIFIGKPSTTTTEQPEEEVEYEDDEDVEEEPSRSGGNPAIDSKFKDALEEEDPEVIKELITLIKRVGGLDELEKQLQLRLSLNENSPIVNGGSKTTTTMSPISKSLYEKVISTRRGLPHNRQESVVGSTRAPVESVTEPQVQRQNKENRYSSVVRNSRPRPQNDGIDKLSETDGGGVMHERPQYVTITRTQTPRTSTAAEDDADFDDEAEDDDQLAQQEEDEDDEQPIRTRTSTSTHQPTHSYVNIRRSRPTTPTTEKETEAEEDADDATDSKHTTRMQYVSIKRTRPSQQTPSEEEIVDATPENKYKSVSRRPTTTTVSSIPSRSSIPVTESSAEYASTATVESLNNQFYTNTPVRRRSTTTATPDSSTSIASETTTTTTTTTSTTTLTPNTQQTHSNIENIETSVAGTATSATLTTDDDQHATSTVTNDQIDDIDDEVTPTPLVHLLVDAAKDTQSLILTKSTAPKITPTTTTTTTTITSDHSQITPLSTLSSSVDNDNDDDRDKKTDPPISTIGAFTVQNPVEKIQLTFGEASTENANYSPTMASTLKPFLGIVSSPRPFGFAKRTRPTFSTTTTSTTPASIQSNVVETVTAQSHVKVSPNVARSRNFHSRFETNPAFRKVNLQSLSQRQVSDGNANDGDDDDDAFVDVVNHVENDSVADTTTNIDRRQSIPATVTSPYTFSLSPSLSSTSSSATTTFTDATANSPFAFKLSSSVVNTRTNSGASHVHEEPTSALHYSVSNVSSVVVAPTQRQSLESRQRTRPRPILSATRDEALDTETRRVANPRTNVIRQPKRGFRPNIDDLLRETSNGGPGTKGRDYSRPESVVSSPTVIDSSQNRGTWQQSNRVWTERLIPAEVTSALPTVSANGDISYRPLRTRPTRIPTTPAEEATISVQRNVFRSRTSTPESAPIPTLIPSNELRESINIAADEIRQNSSVRFSLGRKIGLDASADNRLGPLQRKRVGGSYTKDGGDSPIIFVHPRLVPEPTFAVAPTTTTRAIDTTTFVSVTDVPLAVEVNQSSTTDEIEIRNSVIGVKNIIDGLISAYSFGTNGSVQSQKSNLDLASTTEETKSPEKTETEANLSTVQTINNRGTRPPAQTSSENGESTSRRRRPPTIRRRPVQASTTESQGIEEPTRNTIRRRPVYAQRTTLEPSASGEVVNAGRGRTVYRGRVRGRIGANGETLVVNDAQQQTQTSSVAPSTTTAAHEVNISISTESNEHESAESTTIAIEENEQNSTNEDTRRRPPYSARIVDDTPNEPAQFDSIFALRRRRPVYGRTTSTTEAAVEEENAGQRFQATGSRRIRPTATDEERSIVTETDGKRVRVVTRRRRPVEGRSTSTATPLGSSTENVEVTNGEEEIRQEFSVRRRPVYGRQRTASSAAALIIKTIPENENEEIVTSVRVNPSRRRPLFGRQRTSTEGSIAVASQEEVDQSIVSRRRPVYDEISQQKPETSGKRVRVVTRRRRPVSSTTEASIDELASTELNEEVTAGTESETDQATESISSGEIIESVQTTTAGRRPTFGRRRTTTEASAVGVENVKPIRRRPVYGRTSLRTSSEASVASEIRNEEEKEVKRTRIRSRGQRFRTSSTTSTTEETRVEAEQSEAEVGVDGFTTTDASNRFGTEETTSEVATVVEDAPMTPATTTTTTTTTAPSSTKLYRRKIKKRLRTTSKAPELAQENEEERVVVTVDETSQQSSTVRSGRKRIRKLRKFRPQNQTIEADNQGAVEGTDGRGRDARTQLIRTFSRNQLNTNSLDTAYGGEVIAENENEDPEPAIRPRPIKPRYRPSRPSFSLTSTTESNDDDSNPRPRPFRPRFPRPSRPSFSLKSTTTAAPVTADGDDDESLSSVHGINLFHNSEDGLHVDNENDAEGVVTPRVESQTVNRFVPRAKAQPFRPKKPSARPSFGKNRLAQNGVESLDVNALANRNKQIFNTQNKKHNILKLKQVHSAPIESNVVDELSLPTTTDASPGVTELYGVGGDDNELNTNTQSFAVTIGNGLDGDDTDDTTTTTTTTQPPNSHTEQDPEQDGDASSASTLAPEAQTINLLDILQGTTVRPIRKLAKFFATTTTTAKPTTYHHVFAIDYDESTSRNSASKAYAIGENAAEVISKKVEKLAEVNRIVEVYSKQSKQTLKQHASSKPDSSNLVIERLPTVNKLGEVSRITLIKLVDRHNESKTIVPDFLGFLTTTPSPNSVEAAAQHSAQSQSQSQQQKKGRQIVLPESIFSVETSTIPLEGLFQTERSGKKLNIVYATGLDGFTRQNNFANDRPSPVYVPSTTPSSITVTPATATQNTKPVPLPINSDSSPLVISIANLDSVVLSKVTTSNNINNANHNNVDSIDESTTNVAAEATTIPSIDNYDALATNPPTTTVPVTIVANDGRDGTIAAFSGKVSTIVDAPPHTTQVVVDDALDDTTTVVAPSTVDPSVVNTETSFSSEITKSKVKVSQLNDLKQILAPSEVDHTKLRPQFRPGFRRPPLTLNKKTKPSQSNDIADTTETTTTRTTSGSPYIRRRSRPTYIPTTAQTPTLSASRTNDTVVSKIIQRRKFGRPTNAAAANERKRYTAAQSKSRSTTESTVTTERPSRTPNPYFRRRFGYTSTTTTTKAPTTTVSGDARRSDSRGTTPHSDQELEPSILDKKFINSRFNQIELVGEPLGDGVAEAITTISRAPLPFVGSTTVRHVKITTPGSIKYDDDFDYQITKRADLLTTTKKSVQRRPSVEAPTVRPEVIVPKSEIDQTAHQRPSRDFKRPERVNRTFSSATKLNSNTDSNAKSTDAPKEKPKKTSFRPASDYDYYDDGDVRIIGKANSKVKVILHEAGIIECLDQGNFPHPLSCRKFISCAKMEIGGVVGWSYTCPKGLSYDPVGQICNWSAGLGCKE